jgi:glycosyltransferase involved in cell wall biosynthesis
MKVLFYSDRLTHYLVPTFRELERRLEREGGKFILVSGNNRRTDAGRFGLSDIVVSHHIYVPYHEWKYKNYTLRWQPTLANVFRKTNADLLIVAGHVGDLTYWRLGLLPERANFKYLTWQCGYEYNPSPIKDILTKRFLQRYDYHLAYHNNAKKYLMSYGIMESRITVVHNTINEEAIDLIPPSQARQMVINELKLPFDQPIVLYVGAILAEKRLDLLIDAVRRLRRPVSLIMVGDGQALAGLKAASADLDHVRYPGRVVANVGRFFDAADVFVLPGTGGLAINEAMAHRLPIIASYADGSTPDLVSDGINGYILKDGTAEEIATYLEILLAHPEVRLRMGETSRERIATKYSFAAFIDRIMLGLRAAMISGPLRQ